MAIEHRFAVEGDGETRLDKLVAEALGAGRRAVRTAIRSGRVRVDGRCLPAAHRPEPGSIVEIETTVARTDTGSPLEARRPAWIRRDPPVFAVDKPAGVHSHRGKHENSVADWVCRQMPELENVGVGMLECGVVHRLDRDTTGVLLVAADQSTYERLRRAFASGSARKQYLALVAGSVAEEFTIDIPLARRSTHVVRARRTDRSMSARTRVEPIDCGPGWSLVRAEICTGVTHQVRAHLAMVGHPLLGDRKYGGPPGPTVARRGQLLHASRLSIADTIDVSADVPADFRRAYEHLRNERAGTGESSD